MRHFIAIRCSLVVGWSPEVSRFDQAQRHWQYPEHDARAGRWYWRDHDAAPEGIVQPSEIRPHGRRPPNAWAIGPHRGQVQLDPLQPHPRHRQAVLPFDLSCIRQSKSRKCLKWLVLETARRNPETVRYDGNGGRPRCRLSSLAMVRIVDGSVIASTSPRRTSMRMASWVHSSTASSRTMES